MPDSLRERKLVIRTANGTLNMLAGDIVGAMRERFQREDIYASCLTCLHMRDYSVKTPNAFNDPAKAQVFYCTKYNTYPPLHILINSCQVGYDDNDDIPF